MYLAGLLNNYGFFPRTATLWKDPEYGEIISDLLGRATSAVVSIERIDQLQRQCFWEFDLFSDQLNNLEEMIVFNSTSMVALQNEVSPLLSSIRIMQDLANNVVRRLSGAEMPRSISDTVKKIDKYDLPPEIKELYKRYWNERGGKQIRDYRILDQHYGTIVDHVFLRLSPERNVLLVFPDNPEEQSKKKQTYDKKTCGISILRIGFDEIQEFIEEILSHYKIEPSEHQDSIGMNQWGDLRPFRKRDLGLLYQTKIIVKPDQNREMKISAIRFTHLDDGRFELQNLALSEEKLRQLNEKTTK